MQDPAHTNTGTTSTEPGTDISAPKLREFRAGDPDVWFLGIASDFRRQLVTYQVKKFDLVIDALPPETIVVVMDMLRSPHSDHLYDHIRSELLRHTTESEPRRLQQLLSLEGLGDSEPNELLRRIMYPLGDTAASRDTPVLLEMLHVTEVKDRNSEVRFLIDRGPKLCVTFSTLEGRRRHQATPPLTEMSGSSIKTFSQKFMTTDMGHRRTFSWCFLVSHVRLPIIGAEFLSNFKLVVDLHNHRLLDSGVGLEVQRISSEVPPLCLIRAHTQVPASWSTILAEFLKRFQTPSPDKLVTHSVTHQNITIIPRVCRLAPDCVAIARQEIQHMLDLGFIRPSSGPWSSFLRMVSKKSGDRRLCVEYSPTDLHTCDVGFYDDDIRPPIIGADFLSTFMLVVDLYNRRLFRSETALEVQGMSSQVAPSRLVQAHTQAPASWPKILANFPGNSQTPSPDKPVTDSVTHQTTPTGAPVLSRVRRLAPYRVALARRAVQNMLDLGFVRPSSGPWSSCLHMVAMKNGNRRLCADYSPTDLDTCVMELDATCKSALL